VPFRDPEHRRACNARAARRFRATEHGKQARRDYAREQRREKILARPFVGVDGEGAGVDALGRQRYTLLRAGDQELWKGGRHLTAEECLGFLSDLPRGPIYVGYFFGYDSTQILRTLPPERLERILSGSGKRMSGVEWHGFEIIYLRRKHLRVRRVGQESWITISDVGSFFQCGFVKALETWGVADEATRKRIQAGKDRRGGDTTTAEDRKYNALEVEYLAELMDRFRKVTDEADCRPAAWEGPGYIASALMRIRGIPKREDRPELPADVRNAAIAAYYGGRFELFQFGEVGKAYSYDINSAYPAAMLTLPCLIHGRWVRIRGPARRSRTGHGPWLAHVTFRKRDQYVCDLPIRTQERRIVWPRTGSGWYWGVEIEAAERAGTRVTIDKAFRFESDCDCHPFSWVPELYAERKRLGKSGKGMVLKLGINSLYGKTAQSVGSAPYASPVWAGLITATTRATIIDAYRLIPGDALTMIATDGIYTRCEIPGLPVSSNLGDWEADNVDDLLTVQPGCYFQGKDKVRSRGVNRSTFGPHREAFRAEIRRGLRAGRPELGALSIPVQTFVGLSLALHLGKPEAAGRWERVPRRIAFDHTTKRDPRWTRRGGFAQTFTQAGGGESVPYDRNFGTSEGSDKYRDQLCRDEQPDFEQLIPT
jgi:hypothetical protein